MKNFLLGKGRGQSLLNVQNRDGSAGGGPWRSWPLPWEFLFLKIFIAKSYIYF